MKYTYLLVDMLTILVPLVFSFHSRIRFNKMFLYFLPGNLIVAFLFVAWDFSFTKLGVWGFSDKYTLGLRIFGLPLEEILFFICIPFACLFTYYCLVRFFQIRWKRQITNTVIVIMSLVLALAGLIYIQKLYTATSFITTALLLIYVQFIARVNWLPALITIYPLLLIPFFIVNGILTGTGLEEPVVWYNNNENLGFRLLSIPIEDVAYGLELILANVLFFEWFCEKGKVAIRPGNSVNAANV